jgi:hypothetical protein
MGLDMYLNKRTYVGAEYDHREVRGEIKISVRGKDLPIQFNRVSEIIERVGYWRKANQIHNWFVVNVQNGVDDCGNYGVTESHLRKLLADCKSILLSRSVVTAAEVLPVKPGFFFGGTDYNEYYFSDLQYTINIIEPLLKNEDYKYSSIYYTSSW